MKRALQRTQTDTSSRLTEKMTVSEKIIALLPYGPGFRFVDSLDHIDQDGASGQFHFDPGLRFYQDHFPGQPITPGVILIETMAQIGLVSLGLFLVKAHEVVPDAQFVFTESEVQFLQAVYPGQTVRVKSEKIYFRLGKLKCRVRMLDERGEIICRGTLAGMMVTKKETDA